MRCFETGQRKKILPHKEMCTAVSMFAIVRNAPSVMPDLIRHPVTARLRRGNNPFSPKTWAGWIPAQGRNEGVLRSAKKHKAPSETLNRKP